MPYRGSRKVTMKIEKIMSMIARKKEELKLLEGMLEELNDLHRLRSNNANSKGNHRQSDDLCRNTTSTSQQRDDCW